jgi:hypothetical protein
MQFTIDRATWRCGRYGAYAHGGVGATLLCNKDGMMCCLGHVSLQLGVPLEDIKHRLAPCCVIGDKAALYSPVLMNVPRPIGDPRPEHDFRNHQTELCKRAMSINDDLDITRAERESQLVTLFAEHGHELTFTGQYTEDAVTTVSA